MSFMRAVQFEEVRKQIQLGEIPIPEMIDDEARAQGFCP